MRGAILALYFLILIIFFGTTWQPKLLGLLVCTQLTYSGQVSAPLDHSLRNYRGFLEEYTIPPLISSKDICKTLYPGYSISNFQKVHQKKRLYTVFFRKVSPRWALITFFRGHLVGSAFRTFSLHPIDVFWPSFSSIGPLFQILQPISLVISNIATNIKPSLL